MNTENLVAGRTGYWEVVIGLEVHAQVSSQAKLFSAASAQFGADPNTQVTFLDAGMPGMLPVVNRLCIDQSIKTGLGLNGQINSLTVFDRKNYFYPDLPLGYQITQHFHPIITNGYLDISLESGKTKRVGITRIHMEQDAGKSIHDLSASKSYIDLNRAGVALMEIVSEPDMRSAVEAMEYVRSLRAILRYLGTCDGNMDQGSLRADVNISLCRPGQPFGRRAEIKNVNSIRFIGQAIDYEITRQLELLENGGQVEQETRLFDPTQSQTRSMRNKEDAREYRYFADPDLLPLRISEERIERIRQSLPELPDAKRQRFISVWGLTNYDASILVSEQETAHYFETAVNASSATDKKQAAKLIANWLISEVFAVLNRQGKSIEESLLKAEHLAELVDLILNETISGKIAKEVFAKVWETGHSPAALVEELGLQQVSDTAAITRVIDAILAQETAKVAEYKAGKDKLFGYFIGQVMKCMHGKANPGLVNRLLAEKLTSLYPNS